MKKTLLVLGTGGVATGVITAAVIMGMKVYVVSHEMKDEKAKKIEAMGANYIPVIFDADGYGKEDGEVEKDLVAWCKENNIKFDFVFSSAAAGLANTFSELKKQRDFAGLGFLKGLSEGKFTQEDIPEKLRKRMEYGFAGHLECFKNVLNNPKNIYAASYTGSDIEAGACFYPVAFAKRKLEQLADEKGYTVISIPEITNPAADAFDGLVLVKLYKLYLSGYMQLVLDDKYSTALSNFFNENKKRLEIALAYKTLNPVDDYILATNLLEIAKGMINSVGKDLIEEASSKLKDILNNVVGQLFVERMLLTKNSDFNLLSLEAYEIYANLDSDFKLKFKHGVYLKPFTPTPQRSRKDIFQKVFTKKEILDYGVFGKHFELPDQVVMSECGKYARGTMKVPDIEIKSEDKAIRTKQKMLKSHFKDSSVLPGNILAELCCQAAAIPFMLTKGNEEKLYPMLKKLEDFEPILVQSGDLINIDAKVISEEKGVYKVLLRAQVDAQVTYFYAYCSFVNQKIWEKNKGRVKSSLFS